jgi:hypothetical protein
VLWRPYRYPKCLLNCDTNGVPQKSHPKLFSPQLWKNTLNVGEWETSSTSVCFVCWQSRDTTRGSHNRMRCCERYFFHQRREYERGARRRWRAHWFKTYKRVGDTTMTVHSYTFLKIDSKSLLVPLTSNKKIRQI